MKLTPTCCHNLDIPKVGRGAFRASRHGVSLSETGSNWRWFCEIGPQFLPTRAEHFGAGTFCRAHSTSQQHPSGVSHAQAILSLVVVSPPGRPKWCLGLHLHLFASVHEQGRSIVLAEDGTAMVPDELRKRPSLVGVSMAWLENATCFRKNICSDISQGLQMVPDMPDSQTPKVLTLPGSQTHTDR